jgi:SAM-dependent methyltransferase
VHPDLFRLHAQLEDQHWWFVGRRSITQSLVRTILPASSPHLVVDVGCGTGANIAALSDSYRCIGIDTSLEAISLARERFSSVEFVHGVAPEALGDSARSADLFLVMDVLEHVPDDFSLFSSLLESAKLGALFLITVPANRWLWSEHDVSFGHYRRYDTNRLRQVWSGLPVSVLLLSQFNSRLYPIVRAVRLLTRLRGAPFGMGRTDLTLPPRPINRALSVTFAGEAARLRRVLERRAKPYRRGTSLIAIVRREIGRIPVRTKPPEIDAAFAALTQAGG